ncbi:hypothetical protein [Glaciecola sp. KUL10]|nr:hypothetical protein [Glaciecola sp. KUL10]
MHSKTADIVERKELNTGVGAFKKVKTTYDYKEKSTFKALY